LIPFRSQIGKQVRDVRPSRKAVRDLEHLLQSHGALFEVIEEVVHAVFERAVEGLEFLKED
jgi:hypothetical protein